MNAQQLIDRSRQQDEIVTADYEADLAEALAAQADTVDNGNGVIEYCSDDWRVHLSFADLVLVERMPEHLRASHEAAGNWGQYPLNGAKRVLTVADPEDFEGDEYDRIIRDARRSDLDRYPIER